MSSEFSDHAFIGRVMAQGKELTYEQKQAIVSVKKYMDDEKGQGKFVSVSGNLKLKTDRLAENASVPLSVFFLKI